MSASTAKATRREIRRAVGQDGLDAVNSVAVTVYERHSPRLNLHGDRLDNHGRQLELLAERVTHLETQERIRAGWSPWRRLQWAWSGQ